MAEFLEIRSVALLLLLALTCCDDGKTTEVPEPVAGLGHPEMARVGDKVVFLGGYSAVATVKDKDGKLRLLPGTRLVRYGFAIADGSPAVSSASPSHSHVFTQPGNYAVLLTIEDDRGVKSTVSSRIQIKATYAGTCAAASGVDSAAQACTSGLCAGEVCLVVACAGQKVCDGLGGPPTRSCLEQQCAMPVASVVSAPTSRPGDAGSTTAVDAGRSPP